MEELKEHKEYSFDFDTEYLILLETGDIVESKLESYTEHITKDFILYTLEYTNHSCQPLVIKVDNDDEFAEERD